jgi:beta-lactamase regulating signal transducer with metallopeptidase domain
MIDRLDDAILALGSSADVPFIIKATVAMLVGLTASWGARRAAASARHFLLSLTLIGLLALPLLLMLVPALIIPIPIPEPQRSMAVQADSAQEQVVPTPTAAIIAESEARGMSLPSYLAMLRTGWVLGLSLMLASLGIALWRLADIRSRGVPWIEGSSLVKVLSGEMGIRKSVDVLLDVELGAPVTCGIRRPAIILPADSSQWSDSDIRRALVHELEHIRRRDWLIQIVGRIVCSIYWFHPLMWVTWRKLRIEAERACDDAVVEREEGTEYAQQLVNLARRLSNVTERPVLAMANRNDLSTRVSAILSSDQRRGRVGFRMATAAVVVAAFVVFTLAPMRAVGISPGVAAMIDAEQTGQTKRPLRSAALDRALLEATEEGDGDAIAELVAAGANINCAIDGDGSPLIVAAREGQIRVVRQLLELGADPNMGVSGDGNPLIMASREGHEEIVELLLNRGANVDQVVPGDENALIQASGEGHLNIVKLLVGRGADVNARVFVEDSGRRREEWRTPLSMARKGGHRDVVSYLVSAGAKE